MNTNTHNSHPNTPRTSAPTHDADVELAASLPTLSPHAGVPSVDTEGDPESDERASALITQPFAGVPSIR